MGANKNKHFNFEGFSVNIIRSIDGIRSKGKEGTKEPKESRINAFYRGLGLPAVINSVLKKKTENNEDRDPDAKNNGNEVTSPTYESFEGALAERMTAAVTTPSPELINQFLDDNRHSILDSLGQDNGGAKNRPSGILFPMVVDGTIEIFPQSKRVGPAFSTDSELTYKKGAQYNRPLIETIISIRLKGIGVGDAAKDGTARDSFIAAGAFETMIEDLVNIYLSSLNIIGDRLEKAANQASNSRKKVGLNVIAKVANIAQANPEEAPSEEKKGELDRQKERQQAEADIRRALTALLDFDDTYGRETANTRNVKAGYMASTAIFNIISGSSKGTAEDTTSKKSPKEKDTQDVDQSIEEHTAKLKQAYRTLDLTLGTFSGISGLDILVVITALFTISLDDLIGLLNEQSRENLRKAKAEGVPQGSDVSSAISALEDAVKNIFNEINQFITPRHEDKADNQAPKK